MTELEQARAAFQAAYAVYEEQIKGPKWKVVNYESVEAAWNTYLKLRKKHDNR